MISNRDRADGTTGAGSHHHGSFPSVLLTLGGLRLLQVGGVGFLQVITGPAVHRKVYGVHTHLTTILFSWTSDTHQRFQSKRKTTFEQGVLLQITSIKELQEHFLPVIRVSGIPGQDRTGPAVPLLGERLHNQ